MTIKQGMMKNSFVIVSALRRQLSWTHFKTIMYIDEQSSLGIILCPGKKQEQVELLELDSSDIHVAEYLTVFPEKQLLEQKLKQAIGQTAICGGS